MLSIQSFIIIFQFLSLQFQDQVYFMNTYLINLPNNLIEHLLYTRHIL